MFWFSIIWCHAFKNGSVVTFFFKGEHGGLLETHRLTASSLTASFVGGRSCRGMSLNLWWIWRFGAVWCFRRWLVFIQYGGICCYRVLPSFYTYVIPYLCCYLLSTALDFCVRYVEDSVMQRTFLMYALRLILWKGSWYQADSIF